MQNARERGEIIGAALVDAEREQQREAGEEHRDRADHTADRRDQRIHRFRGRIQVAAGKAGLGDLLRRDCEEEHHEDVVDEVVQVEHMPE